MRYTAAAILFGTFFAVSPVMATALHDTKTETAVTEQQADMIQDDVPAVPADEKKKIEEARKQVVARVNGVPINMYDLTGMMNRVHSAFYSHIKEPSAEVTREIEQRALDRLIFEELAVKEAVKQGIEPKPEDVQKVIDQIKEAYETPEGFQRYLDGTGLTEDGLRERIIRSRRLEGITGREVYQKVGKREDVVQKMYDQYKEEGKLKKADEFFVKEILVMDAENEKATHERAQALLAELKAKNYDFGKLVLDGTFIVRKSKISKAKYPVIYEKMLEMKVGDFSGVVEDNGTFHIFEVTKNELARDMTVEEARGFIEDRLAPYFQEERRQAWMKELRDGADVEILLDDLKEDKQAGKKGE